jgi:hypothetical protein
VPRTDGHEEQLARADHVYDTLRIPEDFEHHFTLRLRWRLHSY